MTPLLCDILSQADTDVLQTEQVLYHFINKMMEESDLPLTNDPNFVAAVVKIVERYETKASEVIMETLEDFHIPEKLLKLHQHKIKNELFDQLMSLKHQEGEPKLRQSYMASYLFDSGVGKTKRAKDIDSQYQTLENIPLLIGDSITDIDDTNKKLREMLSKELEVQKDL